MIVIRGNIGGTSAGTRLAFASDRIIEGRRGVGFGELDHRSGG